MYLKKISISNIRSIDSFEMEFKKAGGWHVIIGDNGAGKSTIVRAIALGLIGPESSRALRLNLSDWVKKDVNSSGSIKFEGYRNSVENSANDELQISDPFKLALEIIRKKSGEGYLLRGVDEDPIGSLWNNEADWFSCAFGPFRRFTGGEKEWMRVYQSEPKAAAHLSVFGEDVALTEALDWMKDLHIKSLENAHSSNKSNNESNILEFLKKFLNEGDLLPHQTRLHNISSEGVTFIDGNNVIVDVTQMSDGYRSILSLTFELIRQLVRTFGVAKVFKNFDRSDFSIDLPGIVLIDEVDAHLHPTWQAGIGNWFLKIFPKLQFIVTTHSPLICRAAENGSIWRLRAPGSAQASGEVTGTDKDRLIFGDLLDAYGTELFGRNVTQSDSGIDRIKKLAELNMKSFKKGLTEKEKKEFEQLKSIVSQFTDVVTK